MNKLLRASLVAGIFCAGYWAGQSGLTGTSELQAQPEAVRKAPSAETVEKIRLAQDALAVAQQSLETEDLYVPAVQGTNAFAVTVGGLDAVQDLERGLGVDPETFVGLYAGMATEEIAPRLGYDDEGRLTYNGRLVRLYPKSRLRQLYAEREKISTGK